MRTRKDLRHDLTRPLSLRLLYCEQPQPHSEPRMKTNGQVICTAAGVRPVRTACCAWWRAGWVVGRQEQQRRETREVDGKMELGGP